MQKFILNTLLISLFSFNLSYAGRIQGKVSDVNTGEILLGCSVYIEELKNATTSGLDGTYSLKNIPEGSYTLVCSFISYKTTERKINIKGNEIQTINFGLNQQSEEIDQVNVFGHKDLSTETSARISERTSSNLLNVVSARSIELSPDQNVANVVQRMPGITLDKSTSGVGQYALLRGMDKRYSYTLINGIKIPSTINKHRYVPLDIFPSDLVDRVEVSKVLTPDMEGDAISGAVNMVMKNAPEKFLLKVNVFSGFSQYFTNNNYLSFDPKPIHLKSPYEENPHGYQATPADFPNTNLDVIHNTNIPVNMGGGLTIGDRFFKQKLGLIFAGSYQSSYKGTNSTMFSSDISLDGKSLPLLSSYTKRTFSYNSVNYGLHTKIDFQFNHNHRIQLYTAYMKFNNTQIRESDNTDLQVSYDPDHGAMTRTHSSRLEYNIQGLFNTTLQGDHQISGIPDFFLNQFKKNDSFSG